MATPLVSFCTVAMNRIHHIKQTLAVNIEQNSSSSIRFLLLDYNSSDGLEQYIQNNFQHEIRSGRLAYYRHITPQSFHRSHARNMAFRLAEGDILCNIDADNFAGPGFGDFVQSIFQSENDVCLTALNNRQKVIDAMGKLCVRKSDFYSTTGFDENFDGYGFEDHDMVNRLHLSGVRPYIFNQSCFLNAISHPDVERYHHERPFQQMHAIYIHYVNPGATNMLFLFNDGSFKSGRIINTFAINTGEQFAFTEPDYSSYQFEIAEGKWNDGQWLERDEMLILNSRKESQQLARRIIHGQETFEHAEGIYYKVTRLTMVSEAIYFFMQVCNRQKMLKNLTSRKVKVNRCFGNGTVFKNFNYGKPIEINN